MNSEEMKKAKFELMIRDIDNYLGEIGWLGKNKDELIKYFVNSKNEEVDVIIKNAVQKGKTGLFVNLCPDGKHPLCEITPDITNLIQKMRACNCNKTCNVSYHLLFWLIFIVCVDNENYNNNLNVVADVAYLLNFTEDMLNDWIIAVKGVLSGEKLYELKYKTEQGKLFFIRNNH